MNFCVYYFRKNNEDLEHWSSCTWISMYR